MTTASLPGPQLISREHAEGILQPYLSLLNQCIDQGWEAWKSEYAFKAHILDARARAAIVYCEIAARAKLAFAALPDVKVVSRRATLTIFIGEEITLRFKKIRKSGRCSNIMTKTQTLFLAQLQLPGLLDGTLVHAGYMLDELQQDVLRKAVVCQLDKRVLWQITITGSQGAVMPFVPQGAPDGPQTQPRFAAKETSVPKEVKGEKA